MHRDQPVVGRQGGGGALVITGPDALATADLAGLATRIGGRPIGITTTPPSAAPSHADGFEAEVIQQFFVVIEVGPPGSLAPSAPFWADRRAAWRPS